MNRRNLIKSAAGLLVAAGAGELLLPERRVWALGTWQKPEYQVVGFDKGPYVRIDGLYYPSTKIYVPLWALEEAAIPTNMHEHELIILTEDDAYWRGAIR